MQVPCTFADVHTNLGLLVFSVLKLFGMYAIDRQTDKTNA